MPDPVAVRSMFGRVAARYDLTNRVLSGGLDIGWRRRLVCAVRDSGARKVLDLATGSGDVAFALADGLGPRAAIVGLDFCQPMLDQAERKRAVRPEWERVEFRQGDALALPQPSGQYDAVTIAFGLRNMADRRKALMEMRRVLRPRGHLFVLEFSRPAAWFRPFYSLYLHRLSPFLAGAITGEAPAYEYLGNSIEAFPDRAGLSREILDAGFAAVEATPLTFGVVALHHAVS